MFDDNVVGDSENFEPKLWQLAAIKELKVEFVGNVLEFPGWSDFIERWWLFVIVVVVWIPFDLLWLRWGNVEDKNDWLLISLSKLLDLSHLIIWCCGGVFCTVEPFELDRSIRCSSTGDNGRVGRQSSWSKPLCDSNFVQDGKKKETRKT